MRRKEKAQGGSDAAKVWPDIENDGQGEGDKTEVRARSKPHSTSQLSHALVKMRKIKIHGDGSDAAKFWPEIENDDRGEGDKTEGRAQSKHHATYPLSYPLANVGIGINFAEALQNSSTLYGVRVAKRLLRIRARARN